MPSTIQTQTYLLSVCFLLSLLFQGYKTESPSETGADPSATPQVATTLATAKPETKPRAATSATATSKPASSPSATPSPTQPTLTPTPRRAGNQAAVTPGANRRKVEVGVINDWMEKYKKLIEDCSKTPANAAERETLNRDIQSLRNLLTDNAQIIYLTGRTHTKTSFINALKNRKGFRDVLFGTPEISFTSDYARAIVSCPATFNDIERQSDGRQRKLTLGLVKQRNQWRLALHCSTE